MIAGKYSNPELGRRNLEILAAATLEATLLHSGQMPHRARNISPPWRSCRDSAFKAYRGARLRDDGLRALFLGIDGDRRDRQSQHRQPAGLAHQFAAHRGSARHPLGVRLGAVPADAAGLVRLRDRRQRMARQAHPRTACRCCRRCTASGRSSRRCCRTWTWCWPRATSPSPRAMPSSSRTRGCATPSSRACAREWQGSIAACCSRSRGQQRPARRQPAAGPLDPQPLPLSRSR